MNKLADYLKNIGPGAMVTAAFIGPGTLMTCIKAGADDGFSLLWVILLSTIFLIFIQEMAARLGVITQKGLGENIYEKIRHPLLRALSISLIISAILLGNTAFEVGNITGCAIGITMVNSDWAVSGVIPVISVIAICFIVTGNYRKIERILVGTVFIMSLLFLLLSLSFCDDYDGIMTGLLHPSLGKNGGMTVMGLVGTTIGPYSIFLHASAASQKWHNREDYKKSQIETILSICLGGLISMCIVIVSATCLHKNGISINSISDFALASASIWGDRYNWVMGIGLFLAGFSSVITAALGASFAIRGVLGRSENLQNRQFKILCLCIIFCGAIIAVSFAQNAIALILLAQALNALLLPLVIMFTIYCMYKEIGVGRHYIFNYIGVGLTFILTLGMSCYNLANFIHSIWFVTE